MEAQHTPGRLEVAVQIFDNDGAPESVIQGMGGAASVAVALDFGANNHGMREANARRLAACWNACEGIPTEALEAQQSGGLPWSVADQIDKLAALSRAERQSDELLAALKKLLPLVEGYQDEGPYGEGWMSDKLSEAFCGASALVDKIGGAA